MVKAFTNKSKIAKWVGMSATTFRRYLKSRDTQLQQYGIKPYSQLLPRPLVLWILEDLGFTEEEVQ